MQNHTFFVLATLLTGICLLVSPAQGAETRNTTKTVKATYPPLALQMRQEGTVKLQAVVGSNGSVNSVIVVSGPVILRAAAVDCVKQWQFEPAKDTALIPIAMEFKLPK